MEILTKRCPKCGMIKPVSEFYKDSYRGKKHGVSSYCKTCHAENGKENRAKNPEKNKEFHAKWYLDNKKEHNEKIRIYYNKKRREDPEFKFKANMRTRLWKFFKKINKSKDTEKLIGCSWEEAREYISKQFHPGMTWENYGEWHIDHVIPLITANSREEMEKLCNYKNTQPLWKFDHLMKTLKDRKDRNNGPT